MGLISDLYVVDATSTSQVYPPAFDKYSEGNVSSLSCLPIRGTSSFLHVNNMLMLAIPLQVSV